MKKFFLIAIASVTLLASSCSRNELPTQSLGEVSYYPKFLFWEADTTSLTKVLELNFNQDAKDEGDNTTAEFSFVDNNGDPVSPEELEIKVNGVVSKNNCFKVDATQSEVQLTFTFLPAAESGKHQGNLRMVKHHLLDRVDNQIVEGSQPIDIFKWTIYFEKNWNPLAVSLIWVAIVLIAALIIWFFFLQPPHFKKFKKSVLIAKNGTNINQFNCDFSGCRKVVFSKVKVKQSAWDRIFNGEIKTVVNPIFQQPLTFTAKRKGRKRVAWAIGNGYTIQSNPIPQSGITIITHYQDKLKITLN